MPELNFQVVGAEPDPYAAAPLLLFKLRVDNSNAEEQIFTITLRCQVQLEVNRRRYQAPEQARLRDLFGEPERWDVTLRPLLWTHTQAVVQQFTAGTQVDLPVPCTFDFNVAATKYFAGLEQGEAPLLFQFSGTIFYTTAEGALQVTQIPWSKEARYRLPIAVWQQMMDLYYPNSAWLCLRRDLFDRLYLYKVERGLPTWEHVLESLLPAEPPAEQPAKAREQ